ncbi:hypothetical protein BCR34DRAFT_474362 [Clohesyomyces aquaticus]|uniref:Fe2OG dioxygenase domain-containing protein n=1 Tax=Clohesyomyces aquaticus TaxID=1231657 RepID=A0A1Y2A5L2_9PLEO|nr:hypothetical protein BCR34DRAFT_474362 [Clohesyomyces aquaticus]
MSNSDPHSRNQVHYPKRELAELAIINYKSIREGDPVTSQKLLEASISRGFFYLDLTDDSHGRQILQDWQTVLELTKKWYDQPISSKMKHYNGLGKMGYKPAKEHAGLSSGTRDGYENIRTLRDDLFHNPSALLPYLRDNIALYTRFISELNTAAMKILSALSTDLNLPPDQRFELAHDTSKPSKTSFEVLRYSKQQNLNLNPTDQPVDGGHRQHTDIGTITLILCSQWGLQAFSPVCPTSTSPQSWQFVAPLPSHAIINIGDTLRYLSSHKLNSPIHRVVPTEELQDEDKFTSVYFLRASDDTVVRGVGGEEVRAEEWFGRKYRAYERDVGVLEGEGLSEVPTGGLGRN